MKLASPAVLFDLDGTLVDSAADLQALINQLLREEGHPGLDLPVVISLVGDGVTLLVERAFRRREAGLSADRLATLVRRFVARYESEPVRLTRPYPRVGETLAMLRSRGYRLAVCTNKLERLARAVLTHLDLAPFFDAIVGSDSVTARKPDPAALHEAMRRLTTTARSTIMVGDSDTDVGAARGAGIPLVLVTYGYSSRSSSGLGADEIIDRFCDLPRAIEALS
jgi:phosphoglycolate phosphatase